MLLGVGVLALPGYDPFATAGGRQLRSCAIDCVRRLCWTRDRLSENAREGAENDEQGAIR